MASACRSTRWRRSACRSRARFRSQVWDKAMVHAVDKAIRDSNLGLSPTVEGQMLRIRIPELNEQRRKEMVKVAHKYAEDARVAVRHVRRDGLDMLKKLLKDHAIPRGRREAPRSRGPERRPTRRSPRSTACSPPRKRKSCRSRRFGFAGGRRMPTSPTESSRSAASRRSAPSTSPSSWTATAAGRRRAACRASKATGAASRRCGARCARRSTSASPT